MYHYLYYDRPFGDVLAEYADLDGWVPEEGDHWTQFRWPSQWVWNQDRWDQYIAMAAAARALAEEVSEAEQVRHA